MPESQRDDQFPGKHQRTARVLRLVSPVALAIALLSGLLGGVGYLTLAPPTPRHVLELAPASDRKTSPTLHSFPEPLHYQSLGFSDNGEFVLTGRIQPDRHGRLHAWNCRDGRLTAMVDIGELDGGHPDDWKFQAVLSPDGRHVAAKVATGKLYEPQDLVLYSTTDGIELWRLSLNEPLIPDFQDTLYPITGLIQSLRFDPESRSLWVTTEGRSVQLDVNDHAMLQTIWHAGTLIAFSSDGRQAAFCSGGWSLLDIPSQRRTSHFYFGTSTVHAGRLEFGDEGQTVIASTASHLLEGRRGREGHDPLSEGLRLLDAATWTEVGYFADETLIAVAADGQTFVSTDGTTLRIRDAVSGNERLMRSLPSLPTHMSWQVTPQPNGGFLHWTYRSGDVLVRDLATWNILAILPSDVNKGTINRQGDAVATIRDNQLLIYDWPVRLSYGTAAKFSGVCAAVAWLVSLLLLWLQDSHRSLVSDRHHRL